MDVLFVGGTGQISLCCVDEALRAGHRVSVFNRGRTAGLPDGVTEIVGDFDDDASYGQLKGRRFDVVCQFIVFTPEQMARDVAVFGGTVGQYVFISTASAYTKPMRHHVVTEEVGVDNPFWSYSRKKADAEKLLAARSAMAWTIVRPSHTLRTMLPSALGERDLLGHRMRRGDKVIVPGDGTSLWTLTRAADFAPPFVRLFGAERALNQDFHLTSNAAFTWDAIYHGLATALGVEARIVHVPSDTLIRFRPDWEGPLHGDKMYSVLFDNAKIRGVVGDFACAEDLATILSEPVERYRARYPTVPGRSDLDDLLDRAIAAQEAVGLG